MDRVIGFLREKNILPEENAEAELARIEKTLSGYMEGILSWNEKINLTSITDRDEFIDKHFLDSYGPAAEEEILSAECIADIGTGGGFPGIPLAVLFPEKKFILIDSLAKRLKVIDRLCEELGIINVTTVHGRAEELAGKKGELREVFDAAVSRAVAPMVSLLELCLPFVRKGGAFISYKGRELETELEDAAHAMEVLGGRLDRIVSAGAGENMSGHALAVIKKESLTPAKYPRKPGDPIRKPIHK